jgi:hypothetical protein
MENWIRPTYGEELLEPRKHTRLRVQDHGFTSIYPNSTVVAVAGHIINIGSGGLAFRYVGSETRTNGSSTLNILLTDGSFCLEKVPFKTIWDSAIPDEFSLGPITLRHCGVQFGELTHSQKLDLEYFIRFYTHESQPAEGSTLFPLPKTQKEHKCEETSVLGPNG